MLCVLCAVYNMLDTIHNCVQHNMLGTIHTASALSFHVFQCCFRSLLRDRWSLNKYDSKTSSFLFSKKDI